MARGFGGSDDVVAERGSKKNHRNEGGKLHQDAARARAAEKGGRTAAEYDAHAFLARLEQHQNDKGDADSDVQC